MKISQTSLNVFLIALALAAVVADHFVVTSAEQSVIVACDTRVSYDKSGTMVCVDTPFKSAKVAQR